MASKRLLVSYATDWLVIIASTVIALLLSTVNPDFHTFCVLDMTLSHPFRPAKLSLPLFILLTIIFPILTITLLTIFTTPRPHLPRTHIPTSVQIRSQKLHSLNNSLLGLGVSLGTSTVIFTGVKSLAGKPRSNLLSICLPDVQNVERYTVGGFGAGFNRLWVMVDVGICMQTDKAALRNAFRGFPSGYATIAFTGLWYLSLFLCHRFGVFVPSSASRPNIPPNHNPDPVEPLLSDSSESEVDLPEQGEEEGAALPVYMLLFPYIPLGLAIFIAGTRYFDFRNHGVDVFAGATVGSCTAWLGFRLYHPALCADRRVGYEEQ